MSDETPQEQPVLLQANEKIYSRDGLESMSPLPEIELSIPFRFGEVSWRDVPNEPGVYVIMDQEEVVYVGMAGRNGKGSIRNRLRDHASGQIVNMFAQYLFLARVQFLEADRISHPRRAKAACRDYIRERCRFRYKATANAAEARRLEVALKISLHPSLNPM